MLTTDIRYPSAAAMTAEERAAVIACAPKEHPVRNSTVPHGRKHAYLAPELKPYTGRAGAMDAFELKSMVNGREVVRRVGCGL